MEPTRNQKISASVPRCVASMVGIAVAYFLLARLGQLLAISPGNVSLIWPASGFALGAALLRWRWVVPGVWLGAFVGNTWAFFDPSTFAGFFRTSGAGVLIATGAVLQKVSAQALVMRF
jgi:integral membrane sensor domain MASE1